MTIHETAAALEPGTPPGEPIPGEVRNVAAVIPSAPSMQT